MASPDLALAPSPVYAPTSSPVYLAPSSNSTNVTKPLTCPNYQFPILGVCDTYYEINPEGVALFEFFDWTLIPTAVPLILAYLSIAAGYYNAWKEGKGPYYRSAIPFWMSWVGVSVHFLAAFSHITLYFTYGNTSTILFIVLWAPSFSGFWILLAMATAHLFNYWRLKYDPVSIGPTAKTKNSPYVFISCGIVIAAAITYCGYIIAVTIKYKSLVKSYVDGGWYIMLICYIISTINVIPMFSVAHFISKSAAFQKKSGPRRSARVIIWWTGIMMALCVYAILVIAWFTLYSSPTATNLPATESAFLKSQIATMQSLLTRDKLNDINILISILIIFIYMFSVSKTILPGHELWLFFRPGARKQYYSEIKSDKDSDTAHGTKSKRKGKSSDDSAYLSSQPADSKV